MSEAKTILLDILAPILLMVGLGALMRHKFKIDLTTLGKLNIYLLVPAFVFDKVSNSQLSWSDMGGVVGVSVLQLIALGLVVWNLARLARVDRRMTAALALGVMFYNSGNFGLPLAELAYPAGAGPKDGAAVQAFVLLTQNFLTFTVGLLIASAAHGGAMEVVGKFFRMPIIYMLAAALLARWWNHQPDSPGLPIFISATMRYLAQGMVPLALVTLGAQLASSPRWPRWKPVIFVATLRLLAAPFIMAGLLYSLHRLFPGSWLDLWPWPAELLILTAAVPTAVNTLLLTLELEGDTETAADCVFWTTVLSSITIVACLFVLRMSFA